MVSLSGNSNRDYSDVRNRTFRTTPVRAFDSYFESVMRGIGHQFKTDFLCVVPPEGGTIKGDEIRAWIEFQTKGIMTWR